MKFEGLLRWKFVRLLFSGVDVALDVALLPFDPFELWEFESFSATN